MILLFYNEQHFYFAIGLRQSRSKKYKQMKVDLIKFKDIPKPFLEKIPKDLHLDELTLEQDPNNPLDIDLMLHNEFTGYTFSMLSMEVTHYKS